MLLCGTPNRSYLHKGGSDETSCVGRRLPGGYPCPVDIARHMGFTKPSITHAITTLQAGGFVERDEGGFIRLTDVGREVAERTYEKHCFFTEMLIEAGVDQETAEADACRMEHAISEDSFQHLKVKHQG